MMFEKRDLETVNGFPIITCTAKMRPDLDKRCFEVVCPDKTYLLQAENEHDCAEWCSFLQTSIAKELNAQVLPQQQMDSVEDIQDSPLAILYHVPGNRTCADCSTPNPDW